MDNELNTTYLKVSNGAKFTLPLGIMTFTFISSKIGLTKKPNEASWFDVFSVSVLAGIGFTMSIFIDGIVSEAKNLGIETMTPNEIARMKDLWG